MTQIKDFDRLATDRISSLPPDIAPLMNIFSFMGEPIVVLAVGSAGFIAALARGESTEQKAFILAALAFSIGTFLKLILKRRRPHGQIVRNFGINSYSFPSGHAFGTVIFYGLYGLIDTNHLSQVWAITFTALVAAVIFLIGISRVYKGVHYPSDVLAGWVLGCFFLAVVNWLSF